MQLRRDSWPFTPGKGNEEELKMGGKS